jgi:Recombinase
MVASSALNPRRHSRNARHPGTPRLPTCSLRLAKLVLWSMCRQAVNVLPIVRELQASGLKSRAALAAALNARGVPTARGGRWSHVQVGAILAREAAPARRTVLNDCRHSFTLSTRGQGAPS